MNKLFLAIFTVALSTMLVTAAMARRGHRPGYGNRNEIYRACKNAMSFNSNVEQCLYSARTARKVIACDEYFSFDDDVLECIQTYARARVVRACAQSMSFSSNYITCMNYARSVDSVYYCSRTNSFDSDKLKCLRRY